MPHAQTHVRIQHVTSFDDHKESNMSRIAIFAYGILSYLLFLAVFLYGLGFIGGFLT
jgi:hypothetical protein